MNKNSYYNIRYIVSSKVSIEMDTSVLSKMIMANISNGIVDINHVDKLLYYVVDDCVDAAIRYNISDVISDMIVNMR